MSNAIVLFCVIIIERNYFITEVMRNLINYRHKWLMPSLLEKPDRNPKNSEFLFKGLHTKIQLCTLTRHHKSITQITKTCASCGWIPRSKNLIKPCLSSSTLLLVNFGWKYKAELRKTKTRPHQLVMTWMLRISVSIKRNKTEIRKMCRDKNLSHSSNVQILCFPLYITLII